MSLEEHKGGGGNTHTPHWGIYNTIVYSYETGRGKRGEYCEHGDTHWVLAYVYRCLHLISIVSLVNTVLKELNATVHTCYFTSV